MAWVPTGVNGTKGSVFAPCTHSMLYSPIQECLWWLLTSRLSPKDHKLLIYILPPFLPVAHHLPAVPSKRLLVVKWLNDTKEQKMMAQVWTNLFPSMYSLSRCRWRYFVSISICLLVLHQTQLASYCILSHHTGLQDIASAQGQQDFTSGPLKSLQHGAIHIGKYCF